MADFVAYATKGCMRQVWNVPSLDWRLNALPVICEVTRGRSRATGGPRSK